MRGLLCVFVALFGLALASAPAQAHDVRGLRSYDRAALGACDDVGQLRGHVDAEDLLRALQAQEYRRARLGRGYGVGAEIGALVRELTRPRPAFRFRSNSRLKSRRR